ncbi:hypothetical protein BC829DRAFT_38276 [Chytridium lagenaria]|nr:hypothetical protein BC829DRAFT_38276 [Chytridium lagenaria]
MLWTSANESGVIGCAPLDGSTVMVESFTQTTELDNSSALASSKILDSGEIPAVCSPTTATLNKDASILDSNMGCTHIDSSASDNSSALLTSQEACEDPALISLPINNKRLVLLSESDLRCKMASSADLTGSTNARSSSMSPPSTTCRIPRCSPTNVTSAGSTNNSLSSKSAAQTTSKLPSIRGISAKTKQISKTHTACSTKSSPTIPRAAPSVTVRPAKPSKVAAKPTPRWR